MKLLADSAEQTSGVFSLGAILYELITGRPPFRGVTQLETLKLLMETEAVSATSLQPGIPRDLETICHKCLEKDPARRYQSALALSDDLNNFIRGNPITARPVGRIERVTKWCRRHPSIAGLITGVAIAFLS